MQQVLSELREYVKQLRKFDCYAARKQCALISPLEKALRTLIEQEGSSTGSAKPHYEKKYEVLYNALKMAVNYPYSCNYFLPYRVTSKGNFWIFSL